MPANKFTQNHSLVCGCSISLWQAHDFTCSLRRILCVGISLLPNTSDTHTHTHIWTRDFCETTIYNGNTFFRSLSFSGTASIKPARRALHVVKSSLDMSAQLSGKKGTAIVNKKLISTILNLMTLLLSNCKRI